MSLMTEYRNHSLSRYFCFQSGVGQLTGNAIGVFFINQNKDIIYNITHSHFHLSDLSHPGDGNSQTKPGKNCVSELELKEDLGLSSIHLVRSSLGMIPE